MAGASSIPQLPDIRVSNGTGGAALWQALNTLAAIAGSACSNQVRSVICATLVPWDDVVSCISRPSTIPALPTVQQQNSLSHTYWKGHRNPLVSITSTINI
jgi:hypothetical protein